LPHHPDLRMAQKDGSHLTHDQRADSALCIFIRSDCGGERRLVVHELVTHCSMSGLADSCRSFGSICTVHHIGYPAAPLEQEAKRIEREDVRLTLRGSKNFHTFPRGRHDSGKNSAPQ